MSNLYKVKDEALVEGVFSYQDNRTGVEKHGWFWIREDREIFKSLATGAEWVWYDYELEELG